MLGHQARGKEAGNERILTIKIIKRSFRRSIRRISRDLYKKHKRRIVINTTRICKIIKEAQLASINKAS